MKGKYWALVTDNVRKGERWYQGKLLRGRGNNPQGWILSIPGNQEKANINKER